MGFALSGGFFCGGWSQSGTDVAVAEALECLGSWPAVGFKVAYDILSLTEQSLAAFLLSFRVSCRTAFVQRYCGSRLKTHDTGACLFEAGLDQSRDLRGRNETWSRNALVSYADHE